MSVLAALAGIAGRLCALGLTASAAWLIARAAEQPPLSALGLAIVAVRALASARGVLGYLERLTSHDAALGRVARLRGLLFRALAHGGRPQRRDGEALTHMVSDLDAAQDLRLRCVLPAVVSGVTGVVAASGCVVLHSSAGAMVAAGVLVTGAVIPLGAATAASRLGARVSAARAELAQRVVDLTEGGADLEVFGAMERAVAAGERQAQRLAGLERASGAVSAAAAAAGMTVQGLTALGVALVSAEAGAVLSAVLVLTTLVALEAVLPMSSAAQLYIELRPAMRRVRAVLAEEASPDEDTADAEPAVPGEILGDAPSPGRIALCGVSIRYGDTSALDAVDLDLPPGRSVAVRGESGAGKSTLLSVLAGLTPPSAGVALLRPARGMYQDAHLFDTTVRANLLMAKPGASDAELCAVLDLVSLSGWLGARPAGLDTEVGTHGRDMSGGQRQRLLLARALLADPEVLLLDEPTEALDAATGRAVLGDVLRARRGRTTVVVTHREDTLDLFDEVIVMAGGRVARHEAGADGCAPSRARLALTRITDV